METLHAGDRINPKWMRLAAVPVLPMALVIFVSQFFGSMISVDPETGIHQGSLYPLFYGFLIFYLVLCLATALVFRTEDNEGQVEGILTAGAFIMAGYPSGRILLAGTVSVLQLHDGHRSHLPDGQKSGPLPRP